MVIFNQFPKSPRLIPLVGLPTTLEIAEKVFMHVFWYFGIPEDIISDRGVWLASQVWLIFMEILGVSVSLMSGYHPQSHGQVEQTNQVVLPKNFLFQEPGRLGTVSPIGRI